MIDLIKEIHQRNVTHRNLTPSQIYLHPCISNDEENGFRLQLIDFDFAHISSNENLKTDSLDLLQIDEPVTNDFYLPVQFEVESLNNNDIDEEKESKQVERHSPGIDTSSRLETEDQLQISVYIKMNESMVD